MTTAVHHTPHQQIRPIMTQPNLDATTVHFHDAVQSAEDSAHQQDYATIKRAFADYLRPLQGTPPANDIDSRDIVAFAYSSIKADGAKGTGLELWQRARAYDPFYAPLVRSEDWLIAEKVANDIKQFNIPSNFPMVSFGPGDGDAVLKRDNALYKALNRGNGNDYLAFDIEREIAKSAADYMRVALDRDNHPPKATYVQGDFSKEWPIELKSYSSAFYSMVGGTMGQLDAHQFFSQFHKKTGGKSLLFFTAHCGQDTPEQDFKGPQMADMLQNVWHLLKKATGDQDFDAAAAKYIPDFSDGRVNHRHVFVRSTAVTIDGERFVIPAGTNAIIGYSARPTPDDIIAQAKGTGMTLVKRWEDPKSGVHAFLMKGKSLPFNLG